MSHRARFVSLAGMPAISGPALLAMAALALAGCEAAETGGDPTAPGQVCTAIFEPVCAERDGRQQSFPNACQARAQDWRVVSIGQCPADDAGNHRQSPPSRLAEAEFQRPRFDNRPGRNPPGLPSRPQPQIYQPPIPPGVSCDQGFQQVCGQSGARTRMFSNRCELQRAGAVEVATSRCLEKS